MYQHKTAIIFSLRAILQDLLPGDGLPIPQTFNFSTGVRPILQRLGREKYSCFLVLNVPELYSGLLNIDYLLSFISQLQFRLPETARFQSVYYEGDPKSPRFMPSSGMISDLRCDWLLAESDFLLVGKDAIDYETAAAARVDFMMADKFFSTCVPQRK